MFLFGLLIICCVQTFERITFTEAALKNRDASNAEMNTWKGLMYTAFSLTTFSFSWIAFKIELRNTARIGACLSLFVAFCLMMADGYSSTEEGFIYTIQALAPFAGASDSFLATAILAAFVNSTKPWTRGFTFGLVFVGISVAFVYGFDHEGILSSLGFMETSDESSFILVCFISLAISSMALVLISLIDFERDGSERVALDILEGDNAITFQWWRTLTELGVFWNCLLILGFSLIMAYIREDFVNELRLHYGWTSDNAMNVELVGILGFLLASPIAGWLSNLFGPLRVVTCGNFALAVSLLVFAFVVDNMEGETMTVGFVTACFGVSATPSVVVTLVGLQENLEVVHGKASGTITASLYISSWVIGTLGGLILQYKLDIFSFQGMAFQCSAGEAALGVIAITLTYLDILKNPYGDGYSYGRRLADESKIKRPYVIQNDWETI